MGHVPETLGAQSSLGYLVPLPKPANGTLSVTPRDLVHRPKVASLAACQCQTRSVFGNRLVALISLVGVGTLTKQVEWVDNANCEACVLAALGLPVDQRAATRTKAALDAGTRRKVSEGGGCIRGETEGGGWANAVRNQEESGCTHTC